jgi:hypothetical protein
MGTVPLDVRSTGNADLYRPQPLLRDGDALAVVQREWNGWRTAMVRVSDLEHIHWSQPSGAPRPLLHAHVCCTDVVSGAIPHECHPTSPPHYLLVCLLKCHTSPGVFEELSRRADDVLHSMRPMDTVSTDIWASPRSADTV